MKTVAGKGAATQKDGCTPNKGWSTISPVLHRASGLDTPNICKCAANCRWDKRNDDFFGMGYRDYNWKWCYLEPENMLCEWANATKADSTKKKSNPRWMSNEFWSRTTLLEETHDMLDGRPPILYHGSKYCGHQDEFDIAGDWRPFFAGKQEKVIMNRILLSWELGGINRNTGRITHYDQEYTNFEDPIRGLWTDYNPQKLMVRGEYFSGAASDKQVQIWEYKMEKCTKEETRPVSIMQNAFSLQVPPCYEAIEDPTTKTQKNGCISYLYFRQKAMNSMPLLVDDARSLVSIKYVRIVLAKEHKIEVFSTGKCEPSNIVKDYGPCDANTPDSNHKTCVIKSENEPSDIQLFSWRISRIDTGDSKCMMANMNDQGQCQPNEAVKKNALGTDPIECITTDKGFTQIRAEQFDCRFRYVKWENCKKHEISDENYKTCNRCPDWKPSRPVEEMTCEKCPAGMYMHKDIDDCVYIPRLYFDAELRIFIKTKPDQRLDSLEPLRGQLETISDEEVENFAQQYLEPNIDNPDKTDQTQKNLQTITTPFTYFDVDKNVFNYCRNPNHNKIYTSLHLCGGAAQHNYVAEQLNLRMNGVYLSNEEDGAILLSVNKNEFPPRDKKIYEIQFSGKLKRCNECLDTEYHSACWANEKPQDDDSCQMCTASCDPNYDYYLHHIKKDFGCTHKDAVTNTDCKPCPHLYIEKITKTISKYYIVVGCGHYEMIRWSRLDKTVIDRDGTKHKCGIILSDKTYNVGDDNCRNQAGDVFVQGNNYKGLAALPGPQMIPYCPPGWHVNVVKTGCDDISTDTPWDPNCCERCRQCEPHQMKSGNWQQCPGNGEKDVQILECINKCSNCYYKSKEECKRKVGVVVHEDFDVDSKGCKDLLSNTSEIAEWQIYDEDEEASFPRNCNDFGSKDNLDWCESYGTRVNAGSTPNENCCICGGGEADTCNKCNTLLCEGVRRNN